MGNYDRTALMGGGDPLYAPGLKRSKGHSYWAPPKKYAEAGYKVRNVRIDGSAEEIAAQCRALTLEMLQWFEDQHKPKVQEGTWGLLIRRYLRDEFSPIQEVKGNTRSSYEWACNRWIEAIGGVRITETGYEDLVRWRRAAKDGQEARDRAENERRRYRMAEEPGLSLQLRKVDGTAYVKRMFTQLRMVASYGIVLRMDGIKDVRDTLAEMRISAPKPRTASPTQAQVEAIIAAADAAGDTGFALGIALQWWLTLRAVDVRGQMLPSGDGKRWADGLTWDMIDRDITTITKTPSKTEEAMPDALVFDLTLIPDVRARLQAIPQDHRIGPVIRQTNGGTFDKRLWAGKWRKYADAAGVPAEIKMMDTRAGAINHAKRLGVDPVMIRNQANHASLTTTDRYLRERSDDANRVIEMRRTSAKQR